MTLEMEAATTCAGCGQNWPCEASRLSAELTLCALSDAEADAEVTRLNALLDAARAENARLRAALLQIEDIAIATAKGT